MASPTAVVPSPDTAAELQPARTGALALVLLSCGHFFVDLYSSALGALQPLLVVKAGMSLTQAGILGGMLVFSSSVMQLPYGFLSDRFHTRLFTVLAPAVAGIFISSLGLAPSFAWLLLLVLLGGSGIASFHPQASGWVTRGVAAARGRWMAVFISSGTLGFALGPSFFSLFALRFGLERTAWAAVPGVAASLLLIFCLKGSPAASSGGGFHIGPLRAIWRPLLVLYMLVFIRSIVQVTYAQFLPLYLTRERGFTVASANYILSLYLAAGALGGLLGGNLADRIGGRRVIMISMIGSVPFLLYFFAASSWTAVAGLLIGGLILLFTIPVNVIMAQELAPGQVGTVSALMMGFAWGAAGLLFIPLTGWAADLLSLHQVLGGLALFPLLGFFLTLALPKPDADARA